MSGFMSETDPAYRFSGWRFYLNSYTKRGRFNWVCLTYGTIFGLVLVKKMFGGKKAKAIEAKK